jgi:hypothetical protein
MPTNSNLTVKNGPNELKFGTHGPWVNTWQLHLSFLKNFILGAWSEFLMLKPWNYKPEGLEVNL